MTGLEAKQGKNVTIMWSDESIGLNMKDHTVIPEEKIRQSKIAVVKHIAVILADWQIFIKPHPSMKDVSVGRKSLGEVPNNVFIVKPIERCAK